MTTDFNSMSIQNQQPASSASGTSPFTDLAEKAVGEQAFNIQTQDGINSPTSDPATSIAGRAQISSTLATSQPIEPSIDDALSTAFIDARTLGIDSWPIRGTQKWEGKVVEVGDGIFTADLIPMGSGHELGALRSEFRTKLLEGQVNNIKPGDIFYMTSQDVRVRGFLTTSYAFHVRKPGNWTASDIHDIRERARQRLQLLEENVE